MLLRLLCSLWQRVRAVWRRICLAASVLWRGLPVRNAEDSEAVADVLTQRRKPGFPCPECGTRISVDIETLLARRPVACPGCRLQLSIDWDEDERARRALESVQVAARELEKARHFKR